MFKKNWKKRSLRKRVEDLEDAVDFLKRTKKSKIKEKRCPICLKKILNS